MANLEPGVATQLTDHLERLYPHLNASAIAQLVHDLSPTDSLHKQGANGELWNEQDVMLITYGDSIVDHNTASTPAPLSVLHQFLNAHLSEVVNKVHILPFYPYTSDDGFSVVDYRQVNPTLGNWSDVQALAHDYDLMFDGVINHISAASPWFFEYLSSYSQTEHYFFEASPSTDVSCVVRPRTSPLLQKVNTVRGEAYVWCTFGHDQIDLNYANPQVLVEVVQLLYFYLAKGASWFRLDAIAYMWKESGTSCIHLWQTHEIIKILRLLVAQAKSTAVLITETNVPMAENIAYFGAGDEAHSVYNFSLPPLMLEALLSQDGRTLSHWLTNLPVLEAGTTFLNFLASHDGIGMRPAEGLLSDQELTRMKLHCVELGGLTSDRALADGQVKTYELNIGFFDSLRRTYAGDEALHVERFCLAYGMVLGMAGVPAIYIHSFLATPNDYDRFRRTGRHRAINRRQWLLSELEQQLVDPNSTQARVLTQLKMFLKVRRQQCAFHPDAHQQILDIGSRCVAWRRVSTTPAQCITAVHNITAEPLTLATIDLGLLSGQALDLLTSNRYNFEAQSVQNLQLAPYQIMWLESIP